MIFLWFPTFGVKLPFILQKGSQNCILGVRMYVSRKSKSSDCFQNFYQFRTSSENFSDFLAKFFDRFIKTAFYMSRANFWEKNYLKVVSILYHLCTCCIFLVFGQRFSTFVKNVVWVSRRMSPKIFVCRKFFLLFLSDFEQEFFWFWPSFLSAQLPKMHFKFTEEKFYVFSRNFLALF